VRRLQSLCLGEAPLGSDEPSKAGASVDVAFDPRAVTRALVPPFRLREVPRATKLASGAHGRQIAQARRPYRLLAQRAVPLACFPLAGARAAGRGGRRA